MKIFEVQTKLVSYKYPVTKIIVSLLIVIFSIFRGSLFTVSSKLLNFLIALICVTASAAAILCICLSIGELFYVRANKKAKRLDVKTMSFVLFDVEKLVELASENDIIEFEIIADKYVEKVGSSSDYDKCKDIFFDKRFYVGENEYLSSAEFTEALSNFSMDGKIKVIAVDGVKTKNLK